MKQLQRMIVLTALVLSVLQATPASAADRVKVPLYRSEGFCANPNGSAAQGGTVRFERDGDAVAAQVVIRGALANESYNAGLRRIVSGTCSNIDIEGFMTDGRGRGRVVLAARVTTGETEFRVAVRRSDSTSTFFGETPVVELNP